MADAGNKYDIGDTATLLGTFRDPEENDEYFDPSVVKCDVKHPVTGVVTTYTYPTSTQMRKLDVGRYACDVDVTVKGQWFYRFYSTGTGKAAEESYFYGKDTKAVAS